MNEKRQTSERLIRRIFNRIFLLISLLNILAVVGYNIVQVSQTESSAIMAGMTSEKTDKLSSTNFQALNNFEEQTDFIRILTPDGKSVMSKGTSQFMNAQQLTLGKFIVSKQGVFDYVRLKQDGTTYELWLSINEIIKNAGIMILFVISIMILTYLIALLLIRRYSRRLSEPIKTLAYEVQNNKSILLVPENPVEIHDLAINFNGLLEQLNDKFLQEQQFVSDASHELRTPITAIRGHVILLKKRWKDHPEIIEKSLNYLDDESNRLKILVTELLNLSRNEQKNLSIEQINLSNLIDELTNMLSESLTQSIHLEGKADVFVNSDIMAIREILTALVENAGKYSDENSEILIKFNHQGIEIIDEGLGIPDNEKTKIFDRFYRVDKSRSETEGLGIGLAIARQYAQKANLSLYVTDNQPKGSIFHVKFNSHK